MLVATTKSGYQVEITSGNHTWIADEPEGIGDDTGPTPYDLLLSSLAGCTLITVQMYARRKGWPLEKAQIELRQDHVHATDCADCETEGNARVQIIEAKLTLSGPLDEEQRSRLMEIAHRCPVHRSLTMETKIRLSEAT